MWYTKEPAPRSWHRTNKQLFEEQKSDKTRSRLLELIENKKIASVYQSLFITKEISFDLRQNPCVLGSVLEAGKQFIKGPRGFRDLRVKGIINKDRGTYIVSVETLSGEIIEPEHRRAWVNLELNPGEKDVEVEIKYVVLNEGGAIAAVAVYPSLIKKLIERVSEPKWKK